MRYFTITPKLLSTDKALQEHFNSGEFARTNYRFLYRVKMHRNSMRVFLYTPSLAQVWYTIKLLMFGPVYDGLDYEQHKHPVQLQVFNIEDVAKRYFTPAEIEKRRRQARKRLVSVPKPVNRAQRRQLQRKTHKDKAKSVK